MLPPLVDALDYNLTSEFFVNLISEFTGRGGRTYWVKEFVCNRSRVTEVQGFNVMLPGATVPIPVIPSDACPLDEVRLISHEGRLLGKITHLGPPAKAE